MSDQREVEVRVSPFLPPGPCAIVAHPPDEDRDYIILPASTSPALLREVETMVEAHNGFVQGMRWIEAQAPVWTENLRNFQTMLGESLAPAMQNLVAEMGKFARALGYGRRKRQYAKLEAIKRGTSRRRR